MRTKFAVLATACSAIVPMTPAMAQEAGASSTEIVVSARKREESILKVPVVANVIGNETIENAQIVDLQGVATKVPGLFVSPGVNTIGTLISIRGVGPIAMAISRIRPVSRRVRIWAACLRDSSGATPMRIGSSAARPSGSRRTSSGPG